MTHKIKMNPTTGILGVVVIAIVAIGILIASSTTTPTYVPQNDDPDEGDDTVTITGNITIPTVELTQAQLNARAIVYVQQDLYTVDLQIREMATFAMISHIPSLTYTVIEVSKIAGNDYNVRVSVSGTVANSWGHQRTLNYIYGTNTPLNPLTAVSTHITDPTIWYLDQNGRDFAQTHCSLQITKNDADTIFSISTPTLTGTSVITQTVDLGSQGIYMITDTIQFSFVCSGRMTVIA